MRIETPLSERPYQDNIAVVMVLSLLLLIVSCSKNKNIQEQRITLRDSDGYISIKKNKNEEIQSLGFYNNKGERNGVFYRFYDNGKLQDKSEYSNGLLCCFEKHYDSLGKLRNVTNFFINDNKTQLLKTLVFDLESGRIIKNKSFGLDFTISDTINFGKPLRVEIDNIYGSNLDMDISELQFIYGNFDSNFNILDINSLDTIVMPKIPFVINIYNYRIGENMLRGFVQQAVKNQKERTYVNLYFKKSFFVKGNHPKIDIYHQ